MRQCLANVLYAIALGGCSLIYNPNNLDEYRPPDAPAPDAPAPDAPFVDADPAGLTATAVDPPLLYEGQGEGGSARAVVVLYGSNILPSATVAIAAPSRPDSRFTIDGTTVARDANSIAAFVSSTVLPDAGDAGAEIDLEVTLTSGPSTVTLPWKLKTLPELTQANLAEVTTASAPALYSQVNLSDLATQYAFPTSATRAIIRSVGSITIPGGASVNAPMAGAVAPGPGGCAGGPANTAAAKGGCTGGGGPGANGIGGGGAGFAMQGANSTGATNGGSIVGTPFIARYGDDMMFNAGAGGGGGGVAGGAFGVGAGGAGGGGGGTLELTAGGNLTLGPIVANGAQGGGGGSGGLNRGGGGGGGGAGGVVVLRSQAAFSVASVTAQGGAGGGGGAGGVGNANPGVTGGGGSTGRIRFDGLVDPAFPSTPAAARGILLGAPASPISVITNLITLPVHGPNNVEFEYQVRNSREQTGVLTKKIDGTPLEVRLFIGWNQICATVPGGTIPAIGVLNESTNCVEAVFLP